MLKGMIGLTFIVLAGTVIHAQDYRVVYPDRVALYSNDFDIVGLRIDSSGWDGDSFYIPNHMIRELEDYSCLTPKGASWIGEKIIEKKNGYTCFINFMHDSVWIKTNAAVGESWIIYNADTVLFKATVTSCDTMSFIGITDSVKRISFRVTDTEDSLLFNDLNYTTMLLSKHYGLLRTFHLYFFPYWTVESGDMFITSRHLVGINKPELGLQNITWLDIYDFQPGDEIHILEESNFWGTDYLNETIKIKKKYLFREDFKDSINYILEYLYSKESTYNGVYTSDFKHDTLSEGYKKDIIFDKLPGEPVNNEYEGWSFIMTDASKMKPSVYQSFTIWENCWMPAVADGCFPDYIYYKGLGGPYTYCQGAFWPGTSETKLVYHKKGSAEWGTPLIITSVEETPLNDGVEIFPNPAGDMVYVKMNDPRYDNYSLSVINMQGQVVYSNDHYSDGAPVDIKGLSGTFIVKINTGESVFMRKIVVE